MTILLLGGSGQLGQEFIEDGGLRSLDRLVVATRTGSLNGERCAQVDLTDPIATQVLLEMQRPSIIVNAAAYTSVDRAEEEPDLAMWVNGDAPDVIGRWAAGRGALIIHYSTDYVFDGSSAQPYPRGAPTAPINAYGRSKLAGERALSASGAAHMILRTGWLYSAYGNNFLLTMLRLGADRDELRVVGDQIGTPTSTGLVVRASMAAIDCWLAQPPSKRRSMEGVHHLVASGYTSWHGFAEAIFDRARQRGLIDRAPRTMAIPSREFPSAAPRPAFSVLDNTAFSDCFGVQLPGWESELDLVIDQLCKKKDSLTC